MLSPDRHSQRFSWRVFRPMVSAEVGDPATPQILVLVPPARNVRLCLQCFTGDGGAYPECHVAQYPLEMGRKKVCLYISQMRCLSDVIERPPLETR
jgi:hypothetical protein